MKLFFMIKKDCEVCGVVLAIVCECLHIFCFFVWLGYVWLTIAHHCYCVVLLDNSLEAPNLQHKTLNIVL